MNTPAHSASMPPSAAGTMPRRPRGSGRVRAAVIAAGVILSLAGAVMAWTLVRPLDDPQGRALYERIRDLRVSGNNAAGARALAADYLGSHPMATVVRQLIHYELGAALYTEHRHEEALAAFQHVASAYSAINLSVTSADYKGDDALYMMGTLQVMTRRYGEAYQSFMYLHDRMPASDRATAALQHANRALIHEELDDWEPRRAQGGSRHVDRSALIDQNLARLAAEAGPHDPQLVAASMLDAINYHSKRVWWNESTAAASHARIEELVRAMEVVAPEARETARARVDLASLTYMQDPAGALDALVGIDADAQADEDESLSNDALFATGRILASLHRGAEARAVCDRLLARTLDPLFEGEVRLVRAMADPVDGFAAGWTELRQIAAEPRFPADVRAAALFSQALHAHRRQRSSEALGLLDELSRLYPDTLNAEAAATLRDEVQQSENP
jgi:hypothetical protein